MIQELHVLLTYQCTKECDHCFVYSSPFSSSKGTFSLQQIKEVINEANKLGTIKRFYFEGGEPFLFFPLLKKSMKLVKENGYEIGIVTNGFWLTNTEDGKLWLKDLADIGIDDLSVSDDCYHNESLETKTGELMMELARELHIPSDVITIQEPEIISDKVSKGKIVGGGVKFRGRAVEKIITHLNLPKRPASMFSKCSSEDLLNPGRVHLDAYGNIQLCQGITMGNMWETPLSEILSNYDGNKHPIWGPIAHGGPIELANQYNIEIYNDYVDECHMCYDLRMKMKKRENFAKVNLYLQPDQVYGL